MLARALGDRISYDQKYDGIKVGFTPSWNGYEPVNVDRSYARGFPLHTYRARSHRFTSNSGSLPDFSNPRAKPRRLANPRSFLLSPNAVKIDFSATCAKAAFPSVSVSSLYRFHVLFRGVFLRSQTIR